MRHMRIQKDGWNRDALVKGPIWYIQKGMIGKGILMLVICAATVGIGIIPVWIYCGYRGNKDLYKFLKKKNVYIHL
ncbi:hypothetical protein [Petroclostridium sp. X23]|uniref:hypothetical protein n=1 Tax=Petroclostridium sp. X23 TaxID=3045146 RepID=UPI0024AD352C|nr:hypothetical protein [Petroclostridium sp. X23]WHH57472.1 hypothetical protein QKW49_16750 [Petroclostridium sp. X23]